MSLPKIDPEYLSKFLVDLLNIPSPTGYTKEAIAFVEKELSAYPQLKLSRTRKGALVAARIIMHAIKHQYFADHLCNGKAIFPN